MKHKTLGQVFTPDWIVNEILNSLNYKEDFFVNRNPGSIVGGTNIITPRIFVNKKIIDPACGDGAFLKIIVERIIDYFLSKNFI